MLAGSLPLGTLRRAVFISRSSPGTASRVPAAPPALEWVGTTLCLRLEHGLTGEVGPAERQKQDALVAVRVRDARLAQLRLAADCSDGETAIAAARSITLTTKSLGDAQGWWGAGPAAIAFAGAGAGSIASRARWRVDTDPTLVHSTHRAGPLAAATATATAASATATAA